MADHLNPSSETERHAEALWHTMWFHALEADGVHVDIVSPDDINTGMFADAAEIDAYNAWQLSRDIPGEIARHTAVVEACRDAYARWGFEVPPLADIVGYATFDSWRRGDGSLVGGEAPRG